jgi:hypothetical protein
MTERFVSTNKVVSMTRPELHWSSGKQNTATEVVADTQARARSPYLPGEYAR